MTKRIMIHHFRLSDKDVFELADNQTLASSRLNDDGSISVLVYEFIEKVESVAGVNPL